MPDKEKLRLDKYLWAIRLFKTRSLATEACSNNKVKLNGEAAKASKVVKAGDQYEVKTEARKWVVQVTGLLFNRVQYAEAIKFYLDLSPEEEKDQSFATSFVFNTGKRKSKQGRPTKKQKRDLDEFHIP
ncbi:MAG: RNA-binding S4 domain-containing protein [Ginsengibacter sp.]